MAGVAAPLLTAPPAGVTAVPLGAEGIHALAVVLAGAAVAGVVVQRVPVVGHLGGVVAALDGPQHRRRHPAARLGGAAGSVDRPRRRTRVGTGRLVGLVLLEQVQRPAAAVDQEHPRWCRWPRPSPRWTPHRWLGRCRWSRSRPCRPSLSPSRCCRTRRPALQPSPARPAPPAGGAVVPTSWEAVSWFHSRRGVRSPCWRSARAHAPAVVVTGVEPTFHRR